MALTFLSSCEDKLDVTNPNNQTSGDFWVSEESMGEGVIAIYNRLLTDGCYSRMTPSLNDVRGDDVWSESPWTIYPLVGDFTVLNDYDVLEWMWREWFMMVYRSNIVLSHINDISFNDADYKNRLLGQTLFLRAFAYYNLVESYENVPIIKTVPAGGDDFYPASSPREDVVAFIIEDLTQAANLLPKDYNNISGIDAGQIGRATSGAAKGLLSRMYMMEENWTAAEEVLADIVELQQYQLVENYADNFTYSNENNSESLFEIQFGDFGTEENWWSYSTTNWRQASCVNYNYGIPIFGAWGDLKPTQWLYEEYKQERTVDGLLDERLYSTLVSYEAEYDTYTDGRSNQLFGGSPYTDGRLDQNDIFLAKHTYARIPGHTLESDGVRMGSIINYRIMRYAEILLSYAETLYELGKYDEAYAPLNEVRTRANLSELPTGSLSNTDLYEEIIHQRVLELSVESIRHFDIKRWGWFYDANRIEQLKTHDDEFETWKEGHEYLPIPSTELDLNPNLGINSAN